MAADGTICVQLCYATPQRQYLRQLELPASSTIRDLIEHSGVLDAFPEIDAERAEVGVFSERRRLDDIVANGDRVEIYRPLIVDPKEVRRVRARGK